ncbi:hypothetical protein CYMTET_3630 [Cymbomonas tetramitiformis]|uniref:Uncharacterized protein n=1 Tax=Cymbomonas tetramitiformis TaxID=36881 RepID=A0AAE0H2Y7_9CHLO|nr:hypothetical protein CYMTET_3630 [Cymbomonas tetramitiformis]
MPSFAIGATGPPPPPPLGDGGADGDADSHLYLAVDSVHFNNQCFADTIARGERVQREELAAQHEEIHLQPAWMIDDITTTMAAATSC